MIVAAAVAAGSVAVFAAVVLWFYNWRPTVGAVVLGVGWIALVGAAVLLLQSALSFDLARQTDVAEAMSDRRRLELEREKKLLLKAIKEIEFDQGMGKIDDAEATGTIDRYRQRAVEIMKLLDVQRVGGEAGEDARRYEAEVEKEVARRLAKVKQLAEEKARSSICSCGARNDADAAFCKKCGKKMGAA